MRQLYTKFLFKDIERMYNLDMINVLYTTCAGLFILLGTLIVLFTNNNSKVMTFSLSCALGSVAALIIGELIPESYENLSFGYTPFYTIILMIVFSAIGFLIIKFLDNLVPSHDGHSSSHYYHIGLMTSLALILHNIIEGMAIYISFKTSFTLGLMVALGVSQHNIPMGMEIGSMFHKYYNNNLKVSLISFIVSVSTGIGALFVYFVGTDLDNFTLGLLLCVTLGMLTYLVFIELIPHLREIRNKKLIFTGIFVGVILFILSRFLE